MHQPTDCHWLVVKWILWYLKGSLSHGIFLSAALDLSLFASTDSNWASYPDDRKSTSGYCVFLGSSLISWASSKQLVVSRSSIESEYCGITNVAAELSWIESLLRELHATLPFPLTLYCDDLSATHLAANPVLHSRAKHVEINYHFIRDKVLHHHIHVWFTSSEAQLADIMTKGLPTQWFLFLRTNLIVLPRPMSLWGDVKAIWHIALCHTLSFPPFLCRFFNSHWMTCSVMVFLTRVFYNRLWWSLIYIYICIYCIGRPSFFCTK